jgi:NTP pyrophosphatase (non-canonical NTP hydrolase)
MTSEKSIYERALEKWGLLAQVLMTVEELSELTQALLKHGRQINGVDKGKVAEEIADVELMIEQMKVAFKIHKEVEEFKVKKIKRLEGYFNV